MENPAVSPAGTAVPMKPERIATPLPGQAASITIAPDGRLVLKGWDFGGAAASETVEAACGAIFHRFYELQAGATLKDARFGGITSLTHYTTDGATIDGGQMTLRRVPVIGP